MSLRARSVMLIILLLLISTACGSPAPTPSPSPTCTGAGCNGKEPSDIKCDADALSITPRDGMYVKEGDIEGVLEIRKAKPALCDRIYWARFTPAMDNNGAFELTLELNGVRTEPQKSEPQNPSVPAWSTVFFAQKGERLRACVLDVSSRQETCTPFLEAV